MNGKEHVYENLVILFTERRPGGDLTLPELAGRDNLMMIIIYD